MIKLSSDRITHFLLALIPAFCIITFSCTRKKELIVKTDILKYPSATGKDFNTVLNDSGKVQLIMSGPILEQYENIDYPYTEFKQGIKVVIYNGKPTVQGLVTCKYAKYNKTTNIWELKDSVVVMNEKNEKLETEVLNWNQTKDLIYTDRFVKITTSELISQGIGFESDSHMNVYHIKKVSAEIPIPDEK